VKLSCCSSVCPSLAKITHDYVEHAHVVGAAACDTRQLGIDALGRRASLCAERSCHTSVVAATCCMALGSSGQVMQHWKESNRAGTSTSALCSKRSRSRPSRFATSSQSQAEDGGGDHRVVDFRRHTRSARPVRTVPRVDSKGHFCGAAPSGAAPLSPSIPQCLARDRPGEKGGMRVRGRAEGWSGQT